MLRGDTEMSDPCEGCEQYCCKVEIDSKWYLCKYAILGRCSIYKYRLGREVYPGVTCGPVEDTGFNYTNCPYNVEGKPLHPSCSKSPTRKE